MIMKGKKVLARIVAGIMALSFVFVTGCNDKNTNANLTSSDVASNTASTDSTNTESVPGEEQVVSVESGKALPSGVYLGSDGKYYKQVPGKTNSKTSSKKGGTTNTTSKKNNNGGGGGGGAVISKEYSTPSRKVDDSKKGSILVWGNANDVAMTAAVADYKKAYPNVQVTYTAPTGLSPTTLKAAIVAGNAPDVVRLDHVYAASMGAEGNLVDLTTLGASKVKSKFTQSCWEANMVGSKVYGLPFDANTICFMYNKKILSKAGKSVPTNFTQLKDVAKAVKASSPAVTPYSIPTEAPDNGQKNWAAFNFFFWLWRNGGEILNSSLTQATFNQQPGIDAMTQLKELYKDGLAGSQYKQDFNGGKLAMWDMGSWVFEGTIWKDPDTFAVAPMITLKSGVKNYSGLGLYSYCIPTSSKNKALAYDFTEFLCTDPNYQLTYCKGTELIPSLPLAQKNSYYTTGSKAAYWKVYIDQLAASKARPGVQSWMDVERAVSSALDVAVKGQREVKVALDSAAATVNNRIKKK